jgi:hypothetical protein
LVVVVVACEKEGIQEMLFLTPENGTPNHRQQKVIYGYLNSTKAKILFVCICISLGSKRKIYTQFCDDGFIPE